MTADAIVAEDLHVAYGTSWALDGVDLVTRPGTTLGVLGHNGAGKTTLIRVVTTLVRPTAGRATVDGFDVVADAAQVRRRIGVTGQYAGLDEFLSGRENLELIGRLSGLGEAARGRAGELIERLELQELAERRVGELSGGSRRRIDLAASLVGTPSVLFLDEPTTGLDPAARAAMWDVVRELTAAGTTVVLTTQYLEEADQLADHIVVLERGRVAARGTPIELKRRVGGKVVTATVPTEALDVLPHAPEQWRPAAAGMTTVVFSAHDAGSAAQLVSELAGTRVALDDIEVTDPSLDDVVADLAQVGARS